MRVVPTLQHPGQNRRQGFTLIEIMIAVSIMAIIVAAGVPAIYKAFEKNELTKAVGSMVEGCSHARAQAILQGVPMSLVIRAEDGNISVIKSPEAAPNPSSGAPAVPARVVASTNFTAQLPRDVGVRLLDVNFVDHMEFPEARVRFFPNGTSDEFTVVLESKEGIRKVSLEIVTALADVQVIR